MAAPPTATEQLTAGIARGDAAAVERFYRAHFDALYAHARRATGRDEAFCLDVVQESVLRVLRAIRPVASAAQFEAWLRLVVRATAYDLLRSETRRGRREVALAGMTSEATAAGGEADVSDAEQLRWLRDRIAAMDPALARLIELRFEQRWTLRRIGAALGLTTSAVDGRLRRALLDLRDAAREAFDE